MFERLKSWWIALFLKKSIAPDERPPKRYPEEKPDVDLPVFRDLYGARNSDVETLSIDEKVKEAVARLKSQGKF